MHGVCQPIFWRIFKMAKTFHCEKWGIDNMENLFLAIWIKLFCANTQKMCIGHTRTHLKKYQKHNQHRKHNMCVILFCIFLITLRNNYQRLVGADRWPCHSIYFSPFLSLLACQLDATTKELKSMQTNCYYVIDVCTFYESNLRFFIMML